MGIFFSRVFQALFGSKEVSDIIVVILPKFTNSVQSKVRILILGLDNAGKTTILYRSVEYPYTFYSYLIMLCFPFRLQNESAEETIQTIPTIGFNVEVLQYKNIKFQV